MHITFDEKFWLSIALISFLILIFKFALPQILASLNDQSKKIVDNLNQAKILRDNAEIMLKEVQKSYQQSQEFAKKIIEEAKIEAEKIIEEAKINSSLESEVKIKSALEKIEQENEQIIRNMKHEIIDDAFMQLEKDLLNSNLDQQQSQAIVKSSIDNLSNIIN